MIKPKEVGERLNALRQERGMSQLAIAALMNVTHQAVSKWETGAALPDIQTLLALSKLYRVSMEELLMGHIARPATISTMSEKPEYRSSEAPFAVPEKEAEPDEKQDKPSPEDLPLFDLDEMAGLLPFLQTDTIDAMMARAIDTLQTDHLAMLAPFASSRAVSAALQDQAVSHHTEMLAGLLPFLRSDEVDERLKKALEEEREDDAAMMAPFASSRFLKECFTQLSDSGKHEMKMILAPFLPRGYLDQLFAVKYRTGKSTVRSWNNDEWRDEHTAELNAQELYELCRDAARGEDAAMLLKRADKTALRGLLQLAAQAERWELVSLAAEVLK